jgi:predicted site-specific integrase-resolvase
MRWAYRSRRSCGGIGSASLSRIAVLPAGGSPRKNRLPRGSASESVPKKRRTVVSLRVSSQAQRPNLTIQRALLGEFCAARGIAVDEWMEEKGL